MQVFKHAVNDTVVLEVEIENLENDITDTELILYSKTSSKGLIDEIKRVPPKDIDGNKIIFHFDTDDITNKPKTYYGRVYIETEDSKLNIYYKLKAKY
jgi:hypothetical protein